MWKKYPRGIHRQWVKSTQGVWTMGGRHLGGIHSFCSPSSPALVSGWSSIVVEGGYFCAANSANKTDIWLEEIPNQLVCLSLLWPFTL